MLAPNGNLGLSLNVAFGGATQAPVPWRGWFMEITPDGQIIPVATGLRSPAGFTVTAAGDWFATDNQGEWVGSGKLTHIERGDFLGHPAGLTSSELPGSPVALRPADITSFGEPMSAKRLPGVKPPAVWLPHTVLGISNSGVIEDLSGGKFGPFAGQLFVADQGQSKIARVSLENQRRLAGRRLRLPQRFRERHHPPRAERRWFALRRRDRARLGRPRSEKIRPRAPRLDRRDAV